MITAVDPERTTLNATDFVNIFRMSGWNERDLRPYFDGQSVTLFASTNEGWAKITQEEKVRFNNPEWRYHLIDLITSQIAPGRWSLEDLFSYYQENGPYNLTMMNGDTLEIDYNDATELLMAGSGDNRGDFFLANMEGIDGCVNVVNFFQVFARATYKLNTCFVIKQTGTFHDSYPYCGIANKKSTSDHSDRYNYVFGNALPNHYGRCREIWLSTTKSQEHNDGAKFSLESLPISY